MSLIELAKEYAFETDVAVKVAIPDKPPIPAKEVVLDLLDKVGDKPEYYHGACCGLPALHMLIGFHRKADYHGAPSDMRERTVIGTSVWRYMSWMSGGAGGLLDSIPGAFKPNPRDLWADLLEPYVGATVMPRNLFKIGQVGTFAFVQSKERFELPHGPLITPSKAYCAVDSVRTMPIDSVYNMEIYIRTGKLPSHLSYSPISENIPTTHLSGLRNKKNPNDQIQYVSATPPTVDFNIDAVVETLRGMVL